jgi:hypothetical protein
MTDTGKAVEARKISDIDQIINEAKSACLSANLRFDESRERLRGKAARPMPLFALFGITARNGISARRLRPRNLTGLCRAGATGYGARGQRLSNDGSGRRTMTSTLTV